MRYNFLFLTFLLLCACCKKKDPDPVEPVLPPITTTGANTFGCKVNGKVWLPNRKSGKSTLPNIEGGIKARWKENGDYDVNFYDFLLFAYNEKKEGFQVYLSRLSGEATISINENTPVWPVDPQPFSYLSFYNSGNRYTTSNLNIGSAQVLRYDTLNRIFSGTFQFRVLNGSDTISVTDGRFDIDQKKIN